MDADKIPDNFKQKDVTLPTAATGQLAYNSAVCFAREDFATFCELILKDEETGAPVMLQKFQEEWIDAADEHRNVIIWAHPESGKAVPLDTIIPTPDGWTTIEKLHAGDRVYGMDGDPCNVIWSSEVQHQRTLYRVTFDDGVSMLADADHQWVAWSYADRSTGRLPRVVTTTDMLNSVTLNKNGPSNWAIPLCKPVQRPLASVSIEPYVLGVWLGAGDPRDTSIRIPIADAAILDLCRRRIPSVSIIAQNQSTVQARLHPKKSGDPGLHGRLKKNNILNNKHIPRMHLDSSVGQRWELLRGLMDAAGHVKFPHPVVHFETQEEQLHKDVVELVRSLGVKCRVEEKETACCVHYRIMLATNEQLFYLKHKHDEMVQNSIQHPLALCNFVRYVEDITEVLSVPVKCIAVDSDEQTYLVGHDYVVTHNTQLMSIAKVLWLLGRDPRQRYAILSATQDAAKKIIRAIKSHIMENQAVADIFPMLRRGELWTDAAIEIARPQGIKDPSVQAFSPEGGAMQGSRINGLIIDDILTENNTRTRYQREKLIAWVEATAFSRLSATAWIAMLSNAWHPDDLAHMLEKKGWWAKRYPVLVDGKSSWPERWPLKRIEHVRVEHLGPLEFNRQMMCRARDDSTARFKLEWITQCLERGEGYGVHTGWEDLFHNDPELAEELEFTESLLLLGGQLPEDVFTVTGVDLGVGLKKRNDPTSIFTLLIWPDRTRQVLEVKSGRWPAPKIIKEVIKTHNMWRSYVAVENNFGQDFIIQWARTVAPDMRVYAFTTGRNKLNPEYGVESLATELAAKMWLIPCRPDTLRPDKEIGEWITEMLEYSPGAHTGDRLISSWIAREYARMLEQRRLKSRGGGVSVLG